VKLAEHAKATVIGWYGTPAAAPGGRTTGYSRSVRPRCSGLVPGACCQCLPTTPSCWRRRQRTSDPLSTVVLE